MTHYSFRDIPDIHRIVRENPKARAIYVACGQDSILLVRHAPDLEDEARQVCHRVMQQHGGDGQVSKLVDVRRIAQDGRPALIFALGYCGPTQDFLPAGWLAVKGQIDRHDHPAIQQIIAEIDRIPTKPRVTVVALS